MRTLTLFLVLFALPACGDAAGDATETSGPGSQGAPKVAIFGVDGATFRVIEPLIRQGKLPAMAALIERGLGVVLKKPSAENASPVLWNTIVTGTPPATHGIVNFGKVVDGQLSVYASSDRKVPALWNLVDARGGTSGVMGVWNTWPAEPVEGYVVSDRFGHSLYRQQYASRGFDVEWGITFPEALTEELRAFVRAPSDLRREELETLGQFSDAEWKAILEGGDGDGSGRRNGLASLKYGWVAQESVAAASLHMLREHEQPDFFMTFLELPDRVSHHFWHAYSPAAVIGGKQAVEAEWRERWANIIPAAYERTDWWIGQMLAELDPDTTVIIVSDHGFQSAQKPGGSLDDLANVGSSGTHHDDGILIAAGPAIRADAEGRASILDVAPLTMAALGLARSEQFVGQLTRSFLDPDFLQDHPILEPVDDAGLFAERIAALPEGVDPSKLDAEYLKHLAQLGYTDASGEVLAETIDSDG